MRSSRPLQPCRILRRLAKTNPPSPRKTRLFVYSLGLLFNRPLRRFAQAHGAQVTTGLPLRRDDMVAVWGRGAVSYRGRFVARRFKRPLLTLEDGFLRSVLPGRSGAAPIGMVFDRTGVYFDTAHPNALALALDEQARMSNRDFQDADRALAMMKAFDLSKYNDHVDPIPPALHGPFALVIDQVRGDAAIAGAGATEDDFSRMLDDALAENQDLPIVIKGHPETKRGQRRGYLDGVAHARVHVFTDRVSPWALFKHATHVYTVSSLMGAEAIFAGHRPKCYGRAFYTERGLTDDRFEGATQKPQCAKAALFHAAYDHYTRYCDPNTGAACTAEQAMFILAALKRHHQLPQSMLFCHMRLWKRPFVRRYFRGRLAGFAPDWTKALESAENGNCALAAWASHLNRQDRARAEARNIKTCALEDGFLRSGGLGAALVRPFSLCLDWTGIYYDPTHPSDCETHIAAAEALDPVLIDRARRLRERLVAAGATKYNLKPRDALPPFPKDKQVVLIPEQVADDASIRLGTTAVNSNEALISQVREDFPDAYLVVKRHPDVMAGLRDGTREGALEKVDCVTGQVDLSDLIATCDHVATMTSLLGFEALIRGKPVTCYGVPFYAGWGLTDDRGAVPARRKARPSLDQLVHAVLIDYPLYWDPITGAPCPPETILDRIETGALGRPGGPLNRVLSKLQGALISLGPFWR